MKRGYRPSREEIQQFYLDIPAANLVSAAREIGCSYASILGALRDYGIDAKPKTRNWKRKPAIPQLADREWLAGQIKVKTYHQIARDLGTTAGNVADKIYRMGLATPHSGAVKEGIRRAYPDGRFGELAGNWRGGRRYQHGRRGGYVLVYRPEHPFCRKDGYVYEHREVAEKTLGRLLREGEVVHHKNGVKDDNRSENLEVWASRSEHVRAHFAALSELTTLKEKVAEYERRFGPLPKEE